MRSSTVFALALALLASAGCATTDFTSTWRAPDAQPVQLAGRKVAAVFMSSDVAARHVAEDALAAEITKRGAVGIPSYQLLGDENPVNADSAQALLAGAGVHGMVTMRVISQQARETYVPDQWTAAPYSAGWRGYWGFGWGTVYEPGYLQTDTIVSVETLVHSFTQDKLLWAGMSQTMNPTKTESLVKELASKIASRLEKEGLLRG